MTFHALRHSAATLLLAAGADIKGAQRILGHAKASHTLDIYADFVPDRVDAAMKRLEAASAALIDALRPNMGRTAPPAAGLPEFLTLSGPAHHVHSKNQPNFPGGEFRVA